MFMDSIRELKIEMQKPYSNEFRKILHLKLIEKIEEENKKDLVYNKFVGR